MMLRKTLLLSRKAIIVIILLILRVAFPYNFALTSCKLSSLKRIEGKYIVLYIHENTDPWVKSNAVRILKIIDSSVEKVVNMLNISLRSRINVTIVPLLTIGKKLGMGKGLGGMAREPFLLTDTGVIVGYTPYNARAHPFPTYSEDVDNMSYLLQYAVDAINIYIIWNYVSYPFTQESFGFFEALNFYIYLNTVSKQYNGIAS